jgi:hypothetical protein
MPRIHTIHATVSSSQIPFVIEINPHHLTEESLASHFRLRLWLGEISGKSAAENLDVADIDALLLVMLQRLFAEVIVAGGRHEHNLCTGPTGRYRLIRPITSGRGHNCNVGILEDFRDILIIRKWPRRNLRRRLQPP